MNEPKLSTFWGGIVDGMKRLEEISPVSYMIISPYSYHLYERDPQHDTDLGPGYRESAKMPADSHYQGAPYAEGHGEFDKARWVNGEYWWSTDSRVYVEREMPSDCTK